MNLRALGSALIFFFVSGAGAVDRAPFNLAVSGNFKQMVHRGDVSAKVPLSSISRSAGTYGVGALADLGGEILVWDGRVLVTLGASASGSTQPPRANDQATLLVTAQVKSWDEIQLLRDMTQKEFEKFVIESAVSKNLDTRKAFPFLVRGEIADYEWHVVIGRPAKRHGDAAEHPQGHAKSRTFSGVQTKGRLLGFYSAEGLEGTISHPGERFHVHYADDSLKVSGHLDRFGVRVGAVLLLPKQ